jgi:hypothetical protein
MRRRQRRKEALRTKQVSLFWSALNSPFMLLIFSSIIVSGGARIYVDHQDSVKDREGRRATLSKLLIEFDHRVMALAEADRSLGGVIGPPSVPDVAIAVEPNSPRRKQWLKLASEAMMREADIIEGSGSYPPSAPEFAAMNIAVICAQIGELSRLVDEHQASPWDRCLVTPVPERIWFDVHIRLPLLQSLAVEQRSLFQLGKIPADATTKVTQIVHDADLLNPRAYEKVGRPAYKIFLQNNLMIRPGEVSIKHLSAASLSAAPARLTTRR